MFSFIPPSVNSVRLLFKTLGQRIVLPPRGGFSLANANKAGHIRRVNALLGLRTPMLVTPLELLESDYENQS